MDDMKRRLFSLCISILLLCTSCSIPFKSKPQKGDRWVSLMGGINQHTHNASEDLPRTDPSTRLLNATLKMGGLSAGGRYGIFGSKIFKFRSEIYFLMSQNVSTNKGVGEYTGQVKQILFGMEGGLNITDYFYLSYNLLPWFGASYTSGKKIRQLRGRTTDLGRAWDGTLSIGAGVDFKLTQWFAMGLAYRRMSLAGGYGPDSSGTSDTMNLILGTLTVLY
ncbi:MAG: hypothetical protein AB1540_06895 [Bdellovibrionota bacterium]